MGAYAGKLRNTVKVMIFSAASVVVDVVVVANAERLFTSVSLHVFDKFGEEEEELGLLSSKLSIFSLKAIQLPSPFSGTSFPPTTVVVVVPPTVVATIFRPPQTATNRNTTTMIRRNLLRRKLLFTTTNLAIFFSDRNCCARNVGINSILRVLKTILIVLLIDVVCGLLLF